MIVHRRIIKLFEPHCEAARRQLPEAGTSDHRTVDHGPPAARRNVNTESTICHNYRAVVRNEPGMCYRCRRHPRPDNEEEEECRK